MSQCFSRWMCVLLLLGCPASITGQEIPKATPEGKKALQELLQACVADGGLKRESDHEKTTWDVVDEAKMRATIRGKSDTLHRDLRDAVIEEWFEAEASSYDVYRLILVESQPPNDERARAFGCYLVAVASRRSDEAIKGFHFAAQHFENLKDAAWQAVSLSNMGTVQYLRRDLEQARRTLERACRLFEESPDSDSVRCRRNLANTLGTLSLVMLAEADLNSAHALAKRSLVIHESIVRASDHPTGHAEMANSLNNIAAILTEQGNYVAAVGHYRRLLTVLETIYPRNSYPDGHAHVAATFNGMGMALRGFGELREAINYYRQSLEMHERLLPRSESGIAMCLDNLAEAHFALGESGLALQYYEKALGIWRKLYPKERYPNGHEDLATCLCNIADLLLWQRKLSRAKAHAEEANDMREKLYSIAKYPQGHPSSVQSLLCLAAIYERLNQNNSASLAYEKAIRILQIETENADSKVYQLVASRSPNQTLTVLGNYCHFLTRNLPQNPTTAQVQSVEAAYARHALVRERIRGNLVYAEERMRLIEKDEDLAPNYVGLSQRLYGDVGDKLHLQTAYTTVERDRSRSLLDAIGQEHAIRLSGRSASHQKDNEQLRRRLRLLESRLQAEERNGKSARLQQLWQDRLQLEDEFTAFERKLAEMYPQYAALRYPKPCPVEHARAALDDNEVALLFTVGGEASYVVVLHKQFDAADKAEGMAIVTLPGRKRLWDTVEAIVQRQRLERFNGARAIGAELYQLLLHPLEEHTKGKNLVIVPDGPLCLLPFELLVKGADASNDGKYLLEEHGIRYAPSMTALHMIGLWEKGREQQPDQPLWALGDPIFDPKEIRAKPGEQVAEVTKQATKEIFLREGRGDAVVFPRLEHSGAEVRAIKDELKAADDFVLIDENATEAAVKLSSKDGRLGRARYVHFATHGILGFDKGQQPALVLNQVGTTEAEDEFGRDDGYLRLTEVSGLKLNADLVVLSACRTGQGRLRGGEGITGLARVFMYAGSRGVVCSMWAVDDRSTSQLMQGLYRRLQQSVPAAEALRQAKLDLLNEGAPPLLWAPFIMLGR